jgi:hypothetical protein
MSMQQIFERSTKQLLKEDLEQQTSLNMIVNLFIDSPFNWFTSNIKDILQLHTKV